MDMVVGPVLGTLIFLHKTSQNSYLCALDVPNMCVHWCICTPLVVFLLPGIVCICV